MRLEDAKPGMRVVILAKDDFFAFVNGWDGIVAGLNNGLVHVSALNPDGQTISLFVPAEQLGRL